MSYFLEKENCTIHNQSCVAITVAKSDDADNLLLCVKCLTDKLSLNNPILLNNEAAIVLNQIKQKEYEQKNLELNNLQMQIESLQNQLNQLKEPKTEELVKSDVLFLYQINESNKNNLQQKNNENQIKIKEFFILVEKQLQKLKSEDSFQQLLNHFDEIVNEKEPIQEQIEQKVEKQFDSTKTPFLKHLCSKHGKEIIVFTLDEDCQGERVLCVECFPKFQHEVITLEDTNKLWMMHQGELFDNQNKFLCERLQKFQQIQQIIYENEEKYQKLQNEIKEKIETKNQDITNQIQDLQKKNIKQSLMQLELKDLKIAINQLSQKNKFYQQQNQQQKVVEDDELFQKEIQNKQFEIKELQKYCKQQLLQLFGSQDLFVLKYYQQMELDSGIFTNVIHNIKIFLPKILLQILQQILEKGHQYLKQLNTADSKIKNREQEQKNINKYQIALNELESVLKKEEEESLIKDNPEIVLELLEEQTQTEDNSEIVQELQNDSSNKPKDTNLLEFSTSLKHEEIIISDDRKTAQSTSNRFHLCLCGKPIPIYGTVALDFKANQLEYLLAGVCLIDQINQDYGESYGIGRGCYFLSAKGHIYSHHNQGKNGKKIGFAFEQNDIISMEVDVLQKQITWKNKEKNQAYTLDIQTTSDLYFCFHLDGQNEIELL